MELAGDVIFNYNGVEMKVRDCPDRMVRKFMGVGHFNPYARPVATNDLWPYSPESCEYADFTEGHWDREGSVLICAGCGLDCT